MPFVPVQKSHGFARCKGNLLSLQVQRIDDKNQFNRRVGQGCGSVERLKGENLLWLIVVQQRKVVTPQTCHWFSRFIPYYNVEFD
jgi:hypothetical protein